MQMTLLFPRHLSASRYLGNPMVRFILSKFGWHQLTFWNQIRKKFFAESVVRHWNRLTSEAVNAPSLELFQDHLGWGLENVSPPTEWGLEPDTLKDLFQPKLFCASMNSCKALKQFLPSITSWEEDMHFEASHLISSWKINPAFLRAQSFALQSWIVRFCGY